MDLYVPSSPCASRKLVAVAFPTLRHHILLLLLLLLLSKRPSAVLKLSKGLIFTPIASTSVRGVHRHQAILTLSLYNTKHIHCLFPKAAQTTPFYSLATPSRARAVGRFTEERSRNGHVVPSKLLGDYEPSYNAGTCLYESNISYRLGLPMSASTILIYCRTMRYTRQVTPYSTVRLYSKNYGRNYI